MDIFLFMVSSFCTILVCCQRRVRAGEEEDEGGVVEALGKETLFGSGVVPLLGGLWLAQRPCLSKKLSRAGGILALPFLVLLLGCLIRIATPEDVVQVGMSRWTGAAPLITFHSSRS